MNRRLAVLGLVLLALPAGCARSKLLPGMEPSAEQDWPEGLVNPLAYTEEMRLAAQRAAGDTGLPAERLRRLQNYLFERGGSFDYETDGTATAIEAFETRSGNCVAFTNLFIAMARSLGIPAVPALVSSGGKPETAGDLILVKNHIVALLDEGGRASVYDFFRLRNTPVAGIQPIDDFWMAAIYQNNRGVQALRDGDIERATRLLESAVDLAPAYAAVYGNLGVARRRGGDVYGALDTYLVALQIDRHNLAIRTNLSGLLQRLAESGSTAALRDGDRALARGELGAAKRHYRRAGKQDPEGHEPLVSMARAELMRGRLEHARELLELAAARAPGNAAIRQLLAALNRLESAPPVLPVRFTTERPI